MKIRRNLSGIFIFDKYETDERKEPTTFEDCSEETQDKWLESLDVEALKNLSKMLGKSLREIGEQFDIIKE